MFIILSLLAFIHFSRASEPIFTIIGPNELVAQLNQTSTRSYRLKSKTLQPWGHPLQHDFSRSFEIRHGSRDNQAL